MHALSEIRTYQKLLSKFTQMREMRRTTPHKRMPPQVSRCRSQMRKLWRSASSKLQRMRGPQKITTTTLPETAGPKHVTNPQYSRSKYTTPASNLLCSGSQTTTQLSTYPQSPHTLDPHNNIPNNNYATPQRPIRTPKNDEEYYGSDEHFNKSYIDAGLQTNQWLNL